ncbi:MAG TPA: hypothetical protein VNT32_10065, partial [Thermoleophilaceae bacterium]|nr:hypothetical protein [Thermoleophilaceae bacterium]
PTSRSVPWLAVRALRRSAFGLVVAGRIDSRARGRVRLLLTDRRGTRVGRAVLRVRRGRFRGLVPLRAAAPRAAWLTLRYGGDRRHLPRSLRLSLPRR